MNAELKINGQTALVEDVQPSMPLLWILRNRLGLVGTKYSCGQEICGACMVLVDGKPRPSCGVKVKDAVGRDIVTIEGLAGKTLTAVQKAWIQEDVSQCGYCQAGQVITATALLAENPEPTDEEIDEGMHGCLCRCGTYVRIRKGIRRAADLLKEGAGA